MAVLRCVVPVVLAASMLAACGGGGGGQSPIPASSGTPSPSPSPPSNPALPGGGLAGSSDVAYVPFRDGALLVDLRVPGFAGLPIGSPPAGSQLFDYAALAGDSRTFYADATGPMGPIVYADAISALGQTPLGMQSLAVSSLSSGTVQIAPLVGGFVAIVVSAVPGGPTFFGVFSSDLRTVVSAFQPTSIPIGSPIPGPFAESFFAIDATQSVVKFGSPSYAEVATTAGNGLSFLGPIVTDGVDVYATTVSGNSTSVYRIDPSSLRVSLVGTAVGALQLRAAAKGRVLLYSPLGASSLVVLDPGSSSARSVPIPAGIAASNNLVAQTLSPDGQRILLGYDAAGVSTVYVLDAVSGRVAAALSSPGDLLPSGQNIVGQIRTF